MQTTHYIYQVRAPKKVTKLMVGAEHEMSKALVLSRYIKSIGIYIFAVIVSL